RPTGILRDTAMGLVEDLIPPVTDEEMAEVVESALQLASKLGVTSLDDMAGEGPRVRRRLLRLYQHLDRKGRLTARVQLRWPLGDWSELADLGIERGFGNDRLSIGGLKGFVDGSLGSSTAKMLQPYLSDPGNAGLFVTPPQQLGKWIRQADAAGLSVAVHAIGDEANSLLLGLFAEAARSNGPRDRRFRIEHAQHLR